MGPKSADFRYSAQNGQSLHNNRMLPDLCGNFEIFKFWGWPVFGPESMDHPQKCQFSWTFSRWNWKFYIEQPHFLGELDLIYGRNHKISVCTSIFSWIIVNKDLGRNDFFLCRGMAKIEVFYPKHREDDVRSKSLV